MNKLLWSAGSVLVSAFLAAGTASAFASTATPSAAPDDNVIRIGHYASLSGSEATFGQSTDRGIKLAIDEVNKAGGLNGKHLELKTYDDQGKAQEAGTAVLRLITDDHVIAVLGEVASSLSLAGGAVCQEKGVPMISPSSTNPRVTVGRDMVFRVCFTDDFQAYAIAQFITGNLKMTKAAILYDQKQAYSKGLHDEFKKFFVDHMHGTIVADQTYTGGDSDFSAQITTIRAANPEIIFCPGYYSDGGNIAIQTRKLGVKVPLIGGDGWDSAELAGIGKEAIEGSYYSNHSAPDQPNMQEFIKKYKAKYDNQVPDALGGLGYDACMVLFDAMKRSKSLGGKDLAGAIAQTKDFKGVTGVITIDPKHNAKKPIVIVQIKKGEPSWVADITDKDMPKK
jgi:branched-chain amino acid transport system substrate-binding protein